MKRSLSALALLALVGCGSSPVEPTPAPLNVTGTWTGLITSALGAGSTSAKVELVQTNDAITGTWSAGGSGGNVTGSVTGKASLSIDLQPRAANECQYNATVRIERNVMTGLYATVNCAGGTGGFVSLVR